MFLEKGFNYAGDLPGALRCLSDMFRLPASDIREIAVKFHGAMLDGLEKSRGPLKMLPSYLGKPTGEEKGTFLSVDFGGTNMRVLLVELQGSGRISVKKRKSIPLKDPGAGYDYTSETATGLELFDFLAAQIAGLVVPGKPYLLGHTFSFPFLSHSANEAILIGWTKEIKTSQVEGRDVNRLLAGALNRRGLHEVRPVAIANDAVSTLLAAAYADPHADIGSICATGHNTCYLEPHPPGKPGPMIINMESGNFDLLPVNIFDEQLDTASERPGEQQLEKMASGRYLGELARLIVCELIRKELLFAGKFSGNSGFPFRPHCLSAEDLSLILAAGKPDRRVTSRAVARLAETFGVSSLSPEELAALRDIAFMVVQRSARLVAATYLGVLRRLDPQLATPHTIAIDGSLYEKMPGYAAGIRRTLDELLCGKADKITLRHINDGSGHGAAIAAAIRNGDTPS